MSELRDPPRILQSGEAVPDLLRHGLETERADAGPDPAHIARLADKLPLASGVVSVSGFSFFSWSRTIIALAGVGLVGLVAVATETRTGGTTEPAAAPASPRSEVPVRHDSPSVASPTVRADELPPAKEPAREPATEIETKPVAQRPSLPRSPGVTSSPTARTKAAPVATERAASADVAEIDLLARAHQALRTRPQETLSLCDNHEAEFAAGRFVQEREALAIEALLYLHRRDEAERRLAEFRRRYPASNHLIHLADLLAASR